MNSNEAQSDAHVAFSFPRVRSVKLSVKRTDEHGRTDEINCVQIIESNSNWLCYTYK